MERPGAFNGNIHCQSASDEYDIADRSHPAWLCRFEGYKTLALAEEKPDPERSGRQSQALVSWAWRGISDWFRKLVGDPIALFTLVLSVFTLGLYCETAGLRRAADQQKTDTREALDISMKSAKAAEASAEAAALNAWAAVGVELPRLEIARVSIDGFLGTAEGLLKVVSGSLTLINHGRSVAYILEDCIVLKASDLLPGAPIYPARSVEKVKLGTLASPGEFHMIFCDERIRLGKGEAQQVVNRQTNLWLYGYVVYRDFLENLWRSKFCLMFESDPGKLRFAESTTYPEYVGRERYHPPA